MNIYEIHFKYLIILLNNYAEEHKSELVKKLLNNLVKFCHVTDIDFFINVNIVDYKPNFYINTNINLNLDKYNIYFIYYYLNFFIILEKYDNIIINENHLFLDIGQFLNENNTLLINENKFTYNKLVNIFISIIKYYYHNDNLDKNIDFLDVKDKYLYIYKYIIIKDHILSIGLELLKNKICKYIK